MCHYLRLLDKIIFWALVAKTFYNLSDNIRYVYEFAFCSYQEGLQYISLETLTRILEGLGKLPSSILKLRIIRLDASLQNTVTPAGSSVEFLANLATSKLNIHQDYTEWTGWATALPVRVLAASQTNMPYLDLRGLAMDADLALKLLRQTYARLRYLSLALTASPKPKQFSYLTMPNLKYLGNGYQRMDRLSSQAAIIAQVKRSLICLHRSTHSHSTSAISESKRCYHSNGRVLRSSRRLRATSRPSMSHATPAKSDTSARKPLLTLRLYWKTCTVLMSSSFSTSMMLSETHRARCPCILRTVFLARQHSVPISKT